jgi:hypothetical protein
MNPIDLQQFVDAELKRLPTPRAPGTLLPRVLEATTHQTVKQPGAGWSTWSRLRQGATAAAAALLVVAVWRLYPLAQPWLSVLPGHATPVAPGVPDRVDDTAAAVRVLWDVLVRPMATYLSVLLIAFAIACAALWSAVERLAPDAQPQ